MKKRSANALIVDAKPAISIYFLYLADPHLLAAAIQKTALDALSKYMGGLWVGGTAQLSETALEFIPNKMNLALNSGNLFIRIPLHDVKNIYIEKGLVTNIICITTESGTFKIRCFSAKTFADEIKEARASIT